MSTLLTNFLQFIIGVLSLSLSLSGCTFLCLPKCLCVYLFLKPFTLNLKSCQFTSDHKIYVNAQSRSTHFFSWRPEAIHLANKWLESSKCQPIGVTKGVSDGVRTLPLEEIFTWKIFCRRTKKYFLTPPPLLKKISGYAPV